MNGMGGHGLKIILIWKIDKKNREKDNRKRGTRWNAIFWVGLGRHEHSRSDNSLIITQAREEHDSFKEKKAQNLFFSVNAFISRLNVVAEVAAVIVDVFLF